MSSDIEPALFAGKTVLVTDADQGLGAVVVKRLAQLGATVYGKKISQTITRNKIFF